MKRKQLSLAIHGVLAVSLLATMPVMAQDAAAADAGGQIGRASCRERV